MSGPNVTPLALVCAIVLAVAAPRLSAAEPPAGSTPGQGPSPEPAPAQVWQSTVGEGFAPAAQSLSLEAGASRGLAVFGTRQQHDLALTCLGYGRTVGHVKGRGHWFQGNLELRAELFAGSEFSPSSQWIAGLTPHLRYDFATGTRLVPFFGIGAGVTGTGIREPDLSNAFEFNLQAGGGAHWFFKDNLALTLEFRYLHLSCAGISFPNLGVNTLLGTVGLSRFF